MRLLRHLLIPDWWTRRVFPGSALEKIAQAIAGSERLHRGEIAFAVEGGLPLQVLRASCRERAKALFGELGVWDTEENIGVLVYVQLVDHDIEIVADRGIARHVAQSEWEAICQAMEASFRKREFLPGTLNAIERVTMLLARHFPAEGVNRNELSDRPRVI
ncbi:MAG TPA: TPM domain-containing protein [Burkholderiales bacterium]|nr:TPM domain-containing protein [Burkholderiales bacterium]